eukprot:TRINITY_DN9967_c0_g1_i1.p1 TRINITY_DN9967_c0_g1~~TRINITY_DN9967_c0_g1_i1.p1  ORF type:complete len:241 (+),score=51.05 TRINITY_DN9967_c0_g1_i1:63-725(+)
MDSGDDLPVVMGRPVDAAGVPLECEAAPVPFNAAAQPFYPPARRPEFNPDASPYVPVGPAPAAAAAAPLRAAPAAHGPVEGMGSDLHEVLERTGLLPFEKALRDYSIVTLDDLDDVMGVEELPEAMPMFAKRKLLLMRDGDYPVPDALGCAGRRVVFQEFLKRETLQQFSEALSQVGIVWLQDFHLLTDPSDGPGDLPASINSVAARKLFKKARAATPPL